MHCANLVDTWADLRAWLEQRDILILPGLAANLPLAKLDADSTGSPDDLDRIVDRLHTLIDHFVVRAVYVDRLYGRPNELALLTVRVLAGGVVHELKLFAVWYVDFLKLSSDPEFVPAP
jgi:hypothetical protein